MLKTRVMNLVRHLRGLPCPACSGPVRWLETVDAGRDDAGRDNADRDPGPPPVCRKCGKRLPISFIEVVLPAREVTCD